MRTLASALLLTLVGCGHSPSMEGTATPAPGSTLSFTASSVTFVRLSANTCGVMNPPFTDADTYSLAVLVTGPHGGIASQIDLQTLRTVPIGQDLPLALMGDSVGQTGTANVSDLNFIWLVESPPSTVDPTALTAATVRFDAFPQKDGDQVQLGMQLQFQDGGALDFDVQAPLLSRSTGCPAG
jgi:hypothetical protein